MCICVCVYIYIEREREIYTHYNIILHHIMPASCLPPPPPLLAQSPYLDCPY